MTEQSNPVMSLISSWLDARARLTALERSEHPDIVDRFGRVWMWWKGELYRHCGSAIPMEWISNYGLPTQAVLNNQNYAELCKICLDGRERHVTPCKPEYRCSHSVCARLNGVKNDD